jgi:hypothetical protein
VVSDGPFAESKEVVGGFWVIDVAGRAEAIEIARRCPHVRHGRVEVHALRFRNAVAGPREGKPVLYLFRMQPGLTDCDGAKLQEMIAFGEALNGDGKFLETAPLTGEPPPAHLESRGGKVLVTDGPFAESKEGVGGYSLVCVADRNEALDIARRSRSPAASRSKATKAAGYLQCAADDPAGNDTYVITTYEPDTAIWEPTYRTRRLIVVLPLTARSGSRPRCLNRMAGENPPG